MKNSGVTNTPVPADLLNSNARHARGDDVPAESWLRDFSPDGNECVTEDAILSADFGESVDSRCDLTRREGGDC